ncbi:MAG: formyltransferase family protein [Bacteroidota bacterium]
MRIVLWIGNGANQKALANKIHERYKIDLIVIENKKSVGGVTFKKMFNRIADKLLFSSINRAWEYMLSYYNRKFVDYPEVRRVYVENINSEIVYHETNVADPHLIIVSGTSMIKERHLSLDPQIGLLNLHTGLSPYVKGGPNCTNWCISNNEMYLIGNTVMWIDKGIDSGNIVATECTPFTGHESLNDVHLKVMEHAHALYLNAINLIVSGEFSNVKQEEIGKGKTYYTKEWNISQKLNLLKNFKKFSAVVASNDYKLKQASVKTVAFKSKLK